VLLLIDNIFTFLASRVCSVGCWAHAAPCELPADAAAEMGNLRNGITSTKEGFHHSFQACMCPAAI